MSTACLPNTENRKLNTENSFSPAPALPVTPSLPPTPRDFDIHRLSLVDHISTRRIAEKHGISQTRVRQVITRVTHWLAEALPVKTDLEQEKETRLAKHLAADQLKHQVEKLQAYFDGSSDPKYLRHQTRVIVALCRLGIVPGMLESLAADATEGPYDPTEPQQPWSEDDPWANRVVRSGPERTESPSTIHSQTSSGASSPPLPVSPSVPSPPPSRACSPSNAQNADQASPLAHHQPPTPSQPSPSNQSSAPRDPELEGLKLMEQRLLTLIGETSPSNTDRLTSLNQTLIKVRNRKAVVLQLSPQHTGINLAPTS